MRITDPSTGVMTPAQQAVADEAIAGKRGRIPGPLRAWLHSPELGRRAQSLGEFIRYDTSLGAAYSELAILVTARFWTSHFEWYAHKRDGLKAGLDPAIIEAIAKRETPKLPDAKAQAIYDYARALHETHVVPPAVHDAAVKALTVQGVVELVGLLGYYTMVAMTLNAFEVDLPEGEKPELLP